MKFSLLTRPLALFVMLGAMFLVPACSDVKVDIIKPEANAHNYDNKVFLEWNKTFLDVERYASGYRPGPAPRALAYMGLAAYEGIVAAIPENNSLTTIYPALNLPKADLKDEYYWPAVINSSYVYLMERFFYHMENSRPQEFGLIGKTFNKLHNQYSAITTPEVLERSERLGREVAVAIYQWESSDVIGHNAFLTPRPQDYVPPTGSGKWQPTYPDFSKATFPGWGKMRRFAMKDADIVARPPVPYSENPTSLYYTQALEVYSTIKNIKEGGQGSYKNRWIAEFWSDEMLNVTFSPGARLVAILNQVVEIEGLDLADCAEAYAKMGLALSDASVALWNSKYLYNTERPATYIRNIVAKQYPDAANWTTILNDPYGGPQGFSPSFPAYPSSNSGFGGAGSKILSSVFEFNPNHVGTYSFTDLCHFNRTEFIGTPRSFDSFKDLGNEDAISGIYLGVQFRMDCDEGLRMGELAAQRILELPWKK